MKDDRGELDLTRQIDELKKNNDSTLDLSLLIDQHRREIHRYKMKESEWIRTQNQLDGNKRIVEELSSKVIDLKKEIDRLSEENDNLRTIDSSHQKLNGELQSKVQEVENEMALLKGIGSNSPEVRDLKRDNKYLAKQVEDYREILRKAGL
jgi:chromosome segregation ATPase